MPAYDVAVVGLGAHGMSIAYHAAKRGLRVLGIEQFDIGHPHGSSHGVHRLLRLGYAEGDTYVPLLIRGLELWQDLEAATGERLFVRSGVLSGSPSASGSVERARRSAVQFGIEHEMLEAVEVDRRFPGFDLTAGMVALLQPGSGFVMSERTIATHAMLAIANGAELRTRLRVRALEPRAEGVDLVTDAGRFHAGQVVVAAGAWIGKLVPAMASLHTVGRRALGFFSPQRPADFAPDSFPAFTMTDGGAVSIYGFPIYGFPGVKIGRHRHLGESGDPDELSRETGMADEECLRVGLRAFLRGADGPCLRLQACLITYSPDEHFILDTLPEAPNVHVVSMCSGHGFKFTTVGGEIVADRLEGKPDRFDLSPFRLSRFAAAGAM